MQTVSRYTMTTPHDNEWEIESLQTRYKEMNGIELDKNQAEKILRYEQEGHSGSSKYFFSSWEELDYEQVIFQEILTSSQFENYMLERTRRLKQIETNLIENDEEYLPQLNAAEERLIYYKNILIPSLHKNLLLFYTVFNSEKEKVDFLRSEYKKFLADAKKQMLSEHFRHCKTFQPIVLRLSLLRHEQMCLFPDYFAFKGTLDIATKAVADYMLEKLSRVSEYLPDALKETMSAIPLSILVR
jgi:tRNA nucleotidyltransferase/poly(A) polymerase